MDIYFKGDDYNLIESHIINRNECKEGMSSVNDAGKIFMLFR